MTPSLHIVTLDVPFPADYGGAIDMYTRILALKQAGYTIHLHCFEYGRGRMPQVEENKLADRVYYYKRKTGVFSQLSSTPYIMKSRENQELMQRLLEDKWPVILEGQHTSGIAQKLQKAGKNVLVRMHNIEWHYYSNLAQSTNHTLHRLYYNLEARKLKRDEQQLRGIPMACITESDAVFYQKNGFQAHWIPPVITPAVQKSELQNYYLFHGNLSVAENEEAVRSIIAENSRKAFSAPVIIAGKSPSVPFQKEITAAGFQLVANPDTATMDELISRAQVHLMITRKVAGIKLKLLQSLSTGGVCIATPEMLENTGLDQLCMIWDSTEPLADLCIKSSENKGDISKRHAVLAAAFSPENYVKKIQELLY
jgi:hypothetical protein